MPGSSADSSERLVYDSETISNPSMILAEARRAKYYSFRVFKPPFVLGLFVMMNFWTYYDRGCMSTAIGTIRTDPTIAGDGKTISETEAGLLGSVFMVGFLVASPLFTGLGGVISAKVIIMVGLLTWCVAVVVTGIMHGFYGLLITRAFVGVGEAAYAGYTVTMVDNMAPPHLRTLWIGIYYAMIPVGTALGMAMGGILSDKASTDSMAGWRLCFLTEVAPMSLVVLAMAFLPNEYNPVRDPREAKQAEASAALNGDRDAAPGTTTAAADEFVPLPVALKRLLKNPDYMLLVFGYGMYTFVVGAVAMWSVSMLQVGPLKLSTVTASLFLGGATAFTGLAGSLVGGIMVDKLGGSLGLQGVYKCAAINAVLVAISLPCGLIALIVTEFSIFAVFFIISVFALFAITAPVNSAILTVVPRNLRTYAISLSITFMHALGDVPSPPIAGAIADAFNEGCSTHNHNEIACRNSTNAKDCVWQTNSSKYTDAYCTNEYQLRNSLMIIYVFISLAIPAYAVVAVRNRRRFGTADDPREPEQESLIARSDLSLKNFQQHE
jgi:MFS family permease